MTYQELFKANEKFIEECTSNIIKELRAKNNNDYAYAFKTPITIYMATGKIEVTSLYFEEFISLYPSYDRISTIKLRLLDRSQILFSDLKTTHAKHIYECIKHELFIKYESEN